MFLISDIVGNFYRSNKLPPCRLTNELYSFKQNDTLRDLLMKKYIYMYT